MSILIFADQAQGRIKKAAFEAIQYGAKVAQQFSTTATVLVLGEVPESELTALGNYGAAKVLHAADARLNETEGTVFTKIIAAAAEQEAADVIIFPHNFDGRAIAPRVAARLKAGFVSGAVSYPDTSNGFVVKKSVFSGKAFANINITSAKKVIAVMPNTFAVEKTSNTATVAAFQPAVNDGDFRIKVSKVETVSGEIPLTEAEIVVSGGRGLKGPENWNLVLDLAHVLGAGTACSRPVADSGWRPHHEHVGQTGLTVRPNLYFAIGISGAIQHLAGVNGSKVIVVINKDPEAPFFKAADYGIVGDAFEVVPKLTAAVKALKG
ncbi:electron transfer flavoprotein subunit alpha/FixB family protein [Chitinophaga sancti]|uniref:Electron transfer flavoprotein alpha subunit apoprotein n=1 Tax=Chitinophaga sancti TaxID=1004 RepID=A0A1K1NCF4_9BACT|nr:electron transfer flavoprotein subunit alpha/FixB family protein [Chitinophaga sancti]WQD63437.1 electron transfer flavoprotein subunit alpha/FixB family protein [Chitinophaga sancti]WQG90937.1 electron transfer flavoprotein subunit alpha/FixB family protein [Chitinophaga sancti]SFW32062.1 electron transfer flavoprotein alpha subunit apoprotein [Chitinophaga sancti]